MCLSAGTVNLKLGRLVLKSARAKLNVVNAKAGNLNLSVRSKSRKKFIIKSVF